MKQKKHKKKFSTKKAFSLLDKGNLRSVSATYNKTNLLELIDYLYLKYQHEKLPYNMLKIKGFIIFTLTTITFSFLFLIYYLLPENVRIQWVLNSNTLVASFFCNIIFTITYGVHKIAKKDFSKRMNNDISKADNSTKKIFELILNEFDNVENAS